MEVCWQQTGCCGPTSREPVVAGCTAARCSFSARAHAHSHEYKCRQVLPQYGTTAVDSFRQTYMCGRLAACACCFQQGGRIQLWVLLRVPIAPVTIDSSCSAAHDLFVQTDQDGGQPRQHAPSAGLPEEHDSLLHAVDVHQRRAATQPGE